MKLKIIIYTLLLCCFTFNTYSKSNKELCGVYCKNNSQRYQLRLLENNTFVYYVNSYITGKRIVNGYWKCNGDTLLLDVIVSKRDKMIKQYKVDSVDGIKLKFIDYGSDILPLYSDKVVINDSINMKTDFEGVIYTDVQDISKIYIHYIMDMFTDSVFYLNKRSDMNVIEFYIPRDESFSTIYNYPRKWFIEGKSLIPIKIEEEEEILLPKSKISKIPDKHAVYYLF